MYEGDPRTPDALDSDADDAQAGILIDPGFFKVSSGCHALTMPARLRGMEEDKAQCTAPPSGLWLTDQGLKSAISTRFARIRSSRFGVSPCLNRPHH